MSSVRSDHKYTGLFTQRKITITSLVKTRAFSVVTEIWSGKAPLITHFQRGVTNGRRSNASGHNWIDLKLLKPIRDGHV